jgi:DNA-damage-inducible protein J
MATINVKVDDELKAQADYYVKKIGLTMSSAISAFLVQVVENHGIPFKLETKDEDDWIYEPKYVEQILAARDSYDPNSKSYSSVKESFDDILGVGWDA